MRFVLSLLAVIGFSVIATGQEKLDSSPGIAPLPSDSHGDGPLVRFGQPYLVKPEPTSPRQPDCGIQPVGHLDMPEVWLAGPVPIPPVPETGRFGAGNADGLPAGTGMSFDPSPTMGGNGGRFWATAEFGLWSLQGSRVPPLVTGSPPGTALANAGVLGSPGTSVLIGDERANGDARAGGRFTIGTWLNQQQTWGIEADFWFLNSQQQRSVAGSNGSQIVARPFVDAQTGAGAAELVSFPGLLAGSATVTSHSDPLYGADLLLRKSLCCGCDGRLDLLAGYRFLRFDESLQIQENLTSLDPASLGANLLVTDHFATRNEFNGGELGLQAEWWRGNFSLQLLGKVAVGNLRRQVEIDGSTAVTVAGFAPVVSPGGLLALSSNSGSFSSDKLDCIPEIGVTAGWQITPRLRATLGYTLLYWPGVVRPGDQIDPVVNPSLLPPPAAGGPARPTFVLRDSDLWIQGARMGLEYRY